MAPKVAPILPALELFMDGTVDVFKPISTSSEHAELTVRYTRGYRGSEIVAHYTLGIVRVLKQRKLDPTVEQIAEIQQAYLEQLEAKLLTDLVRGSSDIWPTRISMHFYSHETEKNLFVPPWLEMIMGLRRKEEVHLRLIDVPTLDAE